MSQDAFVNFYENYLNTPEGADLRDEIDACTDQIEFCEAAVRAGRERGFDFDLDDVRAVMKASEAAVARALAEAEGELSEDELEAVVGGAELSSFAVPTITIRNLEPYRGKLSYNTVMCPW